MINKLLRSKCNFQSGAKCNRPTFLFYRLLWLWPSFDIIDRSIMVCFWNCVWYDKKKDWNTEIRAFRTKLCQKVNLPVAKQIYMHQGHALCYKFVCGRACWKSQWLYSICVDWMGMEEYHKLLQGKKTIKRKAFLKSI